MQVYLQLPGHNSIHHRLHRPLSQHLQSLPRHFHPRGKCREFLRKRYTFPRGRQGYRLHRPLSPHLPFPPLGKVPGFSAKMVHFPPRPTGALAPQASLAALAIPSPGESAGFSCENGSLSPAAGRGTGSTGLSGGTWHFHPWGKCRTFSRKRFTFPRGSHGHRLHRPLSPHLQSLPPGKVPGFPAKTVHFPPRLGLNGRADIGPTDLKTLSYLVTGKGAYE